MQKCRILARASRLERLGRLADAEKLRAFALQLGAVVYL
jgi:hypothetical protein